MSQQGRQDRKAKKRQSRHWQSADWGRWFMSEETLILLVGAKSYKIDRHDTGRIQQHTGKHFHELTEEELTKVMNDLHIDSLDLGDEDKRVINNSDATHSQQVNPLALLTELKRLCDEGIITQEDFEQRKQQLIDKLSKQ